MTDASDYVDEIQAVLGGEDTEFHLSVRHGAYGDMDTVMLSCRYEHCTWGVFASDMPLWEFAADARDHWEKNHAAKS